MIAQNSTEQHRIAQNSAKLALLTTYQSSPYDSQCTDVQYQCTQIGSVTMDCSVEVHCNGMLDHSEGAQFCRMKELENCTN